MPANHAPAANDSPQGDSDYDIILAALMDSARGRAFLHEYALRNRVADTATLLTAIGRLEGLLTSRNLEQPAAPADAAPPSEAAGPVIEPLALEPAATGSEPARETAQIEDVITEVEALDVMSVTGTPEPMPPALAALDGTALQVLAIEFLGPNLRGPETAKVEPEPRVIPAKGDRRDPFAEIRALSDIEKIALFT